MVPVSTMLAVGVTAFISLVLPVLILAVFGLKNKKQGIWTAWLLGACGFLVPQIGIRMPILTAISAQEWFLRFSQEHLFLYAFSLAFTAGLFELAGRYAVAKLLQKKLTWNRALAAGLGHGGIEAMVIVGMAYISNITYILMIQSGAFDAMLTQVPGDQAAYLESIRLTLTMGSPVLYLLAGLERLLTMACHGAMSVIVCRGVYTGRTGKSLLLCLALHTFVDLTAGVSLLIGTTLTLGAAYTIIFIILTGVAAASLLILRRIRREWKEENHEAE